MGARCCSVDCLLLAISVSSASTIRLLVKHWLTRGGTMNERNDELNNGKE